MTHIYKCANEYKHYTIGVCKRNKERVKEQDCATQRIAIIYNPV